MSLHTFDPKLLEFMYQLTLHQKLMTPKEMSQNITIQGQKVSERTIKRWLKHLKENHYFTYHPSIKFERLGLQSVVIILNGLGNQSVLDIIPYKIYLMKGTDFKTNQDCFFINYKIPIGNFEKFCDFWKAAKTKGLIENFSAFEIEQVTALYSPIHKMISPDGSIKAIEAEADNNYFLNLLETRLNKIEKKSSFNAPFMTLVATEYLKDFASPNKVWAQLYEKFGDDVWCLIKKCPTVNLRIKRRSSGVGIVCVQKAQRYLRENPDHLMQQIRLTYGPLYAKNVNLQITVKTKDKPTLLSLIRKISKFSLSIIFYHLPLRNVAMLELVTSGELVSDILSNIKNAMLKSKLNRFIWFDYKDSSNFWESRKESWLKLKHQELFDPKTVSWKYNSKQYLDALNKLSTESRE
jgi:hypothetical protein